MNREDWACMPPRRKGSMHCQLQKDRCACGCRASSTQGIALASATIHGGNTLCAYVQRCRQWWGKKSLHAAPRVNPCRHAWVQCMPSCGSWIDPHLVLPTCPRFPNFLCCSCSVLRPAAVLPRHAFQVFSASQVLLELHEQEMDMFYIVSCHESSCVQSSGCKTPPCP